MATQLEKITIAFIKRNARKRGPTSSDAWNDQGEELASDLTDISSKYNNIILPFLSTVPNGANDLNALVDGLSGETLYVDAGATAQSNSIYWNTSNTRPNSVKEQFDNVYTSLNNSIEDLQALVGSSIPGASAISIQDANDLFAATNVEEALQELAGSISSYSSPNSAVDFTISNRLTVGQSTTSTFGLSYFKSQAADSVPTVFTPNDIVIGNPVDIGIGSGALFFRYNSTNEQALIGALSPSLAWRSLILAAARVVIQNAAGGYVMQLPGVNSNNSAMRNDGQHTWSSTTDAAGTIDVGIARDAANRLKVTNGTTGNGNLNLPGAGATNGETLVYTSLSANVTLNTGSTTTTSALNIPANAMVLDVVGRVTTAITTAANYSVGVAGATTRYLNASTAITLGSNWVGIDTNPRKYTASTAIVLTTNVNPGAGVVRVTVFYYLPTAPTS